MATKKKLHFSTHAELKNVIGQDLINDDNIALIELVKNGIDAGARRITLTFVDQTGSDIELRAPAIFVEDDGAGMSVDDVTQKWLNIAYSEKKDMQIKGRELAGNKGVGRFACDRLGSRLDMFTRRKEGPLLHVEVDWTAFEGKKNVQDTIQKVTVLQSEVVAADMQRHVGKALRSKGTLLAISRLRQVWGREQLLQLKRTLQRFVNPIAAFDRGSVDILIDAPSCRDEDLLSDAHEQVNGSVTNQIFDKLKFKTTYIELNLGDDGKSLITELFHEGQRVYRLVEERQDFALLKGTSLVLHYMNPYKKAYFKRETGLHLVDFGSIMLFVKGYRVSPYGDRGNDWLGVDSRKVQATTRNLGGRELLGIISVPGTNLRMVSNREGVVKDLAFVALTAREGLFFTALTRLERFVVDGLKWDSVPQSVRLRLQAGAVPGEADMPSGEVYDESVDLKRRRIALDVLRIVGAAPSTTKELEIDPEILDALSREREQDVKTILDRFGAFDQGAVGHGVQLALGRVQREFERQKEVLEQTRKDASRKDRQVTRLKSVARGIAEKNVKLERQVKTQQSEVLFSRLTSSTDREQLLLLHHQAGLYAQTAQNFLDKALKQLRQGDTAKAEEWVAKALNSTNKAVKVSNFATKANFRMRTGVLTEDIVSFVREYVLNVAKDGSAQNLKLSITGDIDSPFVMRFKPVDLAVVVDNIAYNSDRAGAARLNINMDRPAENELRLEFVDDGPDGLSPEVQPPEMVFERGVTTTKGSGLGLYHVRETIKELGGSIELKEMEGAGFGVVIRLFK
jgi:signal transduction histidine kinase/anti-sigma regulatory factor (Ser/Thr protein kinase)